ncbi:MAG: hypothetical protein PHQ40_10685 [Anaerolineaceae bacterium]|nr:hypothetical protein [Anaerolineaceae bacterium]
MHRITSCNRKLLAIALLILLIAGGCASGQGENSTRQPEGVYAVESVFREFYDLLGGEAVLGYAISPLMEYGNVKMQYTESALMRYDALAPASEKYSLAGLGQELHLTDQPIVLPEQSGERIVDGYILYDEFVPLYDKLQQTRFAGRPLTQVHIDYDRGRIEQYFENVGMYRLLSDPPKQVHLLAFGAWKCDAFCSYTTPEVARVAPQPVFPEPLISSLARLGPGFTGRPLSEPYIAADGRLEQIYENVVVSADPTNLRTIALRPIPPEVGFPPSPNVPKQEDDRMVFYPIEGGMGHHVPKVFEVYITEHGGLELSGMPTTELFQVENVYRQCFTNYCLDYDPNASETLRIRPTPLGRLYLKLHSPSQDAAGTVTVTPAGYHVTVWEQHALAPSGAEQVIHIEVTQAENLSPAPGVEASITLYTPDGSQTSFHFQPTDASGKAAVSLPPVVAPNGTLVPYQVCVNTTTAAPMCVKDSYVIWGSK